MSSSIMTLSKKQSIPATEHYRYCIIAMAISAVLFPYTTQAAQTFNPEALNLGVENQVADINNLDYFSYAGGQLPGVYSVDIYLNEKLIDNRQISFIFDDDKKALVPEITKQDLLNWGVKETTTPTLNQLNSTATITDIASVIPNATHKYDFSRARLSFSIPQIALYNYGQGYISPTEWNDGINAAFVNYTYRQNKYWYQEQKDSNSIFLGLRSGVNVGAWRLRNHSTYNKNSDNASEWNNLQTYVERDIRSLKSRLTIGETASDDGILESTPYRGIKLASDESMLPQSQRGFAPVVRGIAQSNAVVTVRQNNSVIYQTSVPPGEFAISDLYPTSYSGDLQVTIEEADGTTRTFSQPFSAVPMMQRAGSLKYSFDIGKYNADNAARKPTFLQTTAIYGLPYNLSIYGGTLLSSDYQAYVLGTGINLGYIGAVSTDITYARTTLLDDTDAQGQSYRIQYSKYLPETKTGFSLASYRYSTKDYYDFSSTNEQLSHLNHKKKQFQVSISQSLGDIGYLSLNGYQQYYWDRDRVDRNATLSFNSNYRSLSYSVSYAYNKRQDNELTDQILSINFSLTFDITNNNNWLSYRYNTSKQGDSISSVSLSGTQLEDNNLQYDISQNYNHTRQEYSGSVNSNYTASGGELSAGYSYDKRYQSVNWSATGALLVHQGGVTPSRTIYDSAILIKAEDVDHLKVSSTQSLYTNSQGYAVIPNVSRYERNKVTVDPASLTGNNDVELTSTTVIPTKGAIVLADFKARKGARVLVSLHYNDAVLPFGTQVEIYQDDRVISSGIIANEGEVFLNGVPEQSLLRAKWGNSQTEQCQATLKADLSLEKIQFLQLDCR
ncbi:outer membrane usher protein [Proteus hauseri ATCC 700826]|uniref:Outer membrane usher protein n=2 Tax=Proteus hauseri TaxID=183417 RepID=A0AAJ3LUT6_PROHU|nr:fimbria/pilus outer membrane usher protein [Proteus hauseri]OAT49341.1 outer membrane usher protein [Proteus hauseri ATCC 700826]